MFYIQYDEVGNISATVNTSSAAPIYPRQLSFDEPFSTSGKMVDINTLEIKDVPHLLEEQQP